MTDDQMDTVVRAYEIKLKKSFDDYYGLLLENNRLEDKLRKAKSIITHPTETFIEEEVDD